MLLNTKFIHISVLQQMNLTIISVDIIKIYINSRLVIYNVVNCL